MFRVSLPESEVRTCSALQQYKSRKKKNQVFSFSCISAVEKSVSLPIAGSIEESLEEKWKEIKYRNGVFGVRIT